MKHVLLLAAAGLITWGCGAEHAAPVNPPPVSAPVTVGDYELGSPIQQGNVAIVPVMLKDIGTQQKGEEITLAEAKKLGVVEIIEIPGAEEVNRLRVHNKSDRPLLLLGGELLLGGKQDRIVVHDVIIPPGETQDVEVDCVEHGRWDGHTLHFEFSSKMVPMKVREAAAYEGQSEVWANVAGFNQDAGAAPASGTVRGGLDSPEVNKKIQEALPEIERKLSSNSRAVGVLYVLNGEVRSMDLFGTTTIFQAAKEGLLHSYLSDAAVVKEQTTKEVTPDELKGFITEALGSKREQGKAKDVYFVSGERLRGNELRFGNSAGGKVLHGSYSKSR